MLVIGLIINFPGVPLSNSSFPGGKLGHNRILSDPGPSDAENGMPDLRTGSPPMCCLGSGIGKKNKKNVRLTLFLQHLKNEV